MKIARVRSRRQCSFLLTNARSSWRAASAPPPHRQRVEEVCQQRFDARLAAIQRECDAELAKAQRAAAEAKELSNRQAEALKALNQAFTAIRSDTSAVGLLGRARALPCLPSPALHPSVPSPVRPSHSHCAYRYVTAFKEHVPARVVNVASHSRPQ